MVAAPAFVKHITDNVDECWNKKDTIDFKNYE